MSIVNVIKKIFMNYLVPCTILIGSFLLFLISVNILFYIKRFYLFLLLFFFLICLIFSVFVNKQKIAQIIHVFFFVFFLTLLGLIIKLTILENNPWTLFYEIHTTGNVTQKLYFQQTKIAKLFPTKTEIFSTYFLFCLKNYLNPKTPINENVFGFNITFHSYADLILLLREIFIDKDYYVALCNNSPTIIDCGCNEGLSILFFKMVYPDSKIIGFEAHPKSFEILSKNIENNKLLNITLINKAVYKSEGAIAFSLNNGLGSQILNDTKEKSFISVTSTLLSTYISAPVDLLKMDIEGAESTVIEELAQHKKLKFIKNIIMEFHLLANKNHNNFAKTLLTLEENGFSYKINKIDSAFALLIIHAYQN